MRAMFYTTMLAAIVACCLAELARAEAVGGAGNDSGDEAVPTDPLASSSTGIQEIVVTAQRRTENVQQSSLAIQVVGDKDLVRQGVAEARDLTSVAPNLVISQTGSFTQTNLRGVGDFPIDGLAQLAVSYSIDGVVEASPAGISSNFYDLARIEVLKGPQGTLYGRNATGGAVNILTNRPELSTGGYLTGEAGNFADKHLTGALNFAVSNTLAVRGAFNWIDRDGYLSDGTDDNKRQAGRISMLWEPGERVNLRVSADYAHQGGAGGGTVLFPVQPGTGPWTSISNPINNAALSSATNGLHAPNVGDNRIDNTQWNLIAELNVKLGNFATFTFLPGYRYLDMDEVAYYVGTRYVTDPQRSKQTTFEARIGNQTNALKWTLGAFHFDEDARFRFASAVVQPPILPGFDTTGDISKSVNRSDAVFADANYSLTNRLRIIGGGRYTKDDVYFRGLYTDNSIGAPPPAPQSGQRNFHAATWRGGAEFDVSPHSMAYFTASKGYKSGGFFIVTAGDDNSYRPEQLTAFDLGIRNRFFNNMLQVNLEAYYWLYRDQQLSAVGYTASGGIAFTTRNAGSADPRGIDADVVWKPTRNDTLSFSASYIRARYSAFDIDYPAALISLLRTGPDCRVPSTPGVNASGLPIYRISCAGAPLPRTPEWSGSANYMRVVPLSDGASLAGDIGATLATSRFLSADFYVPELRDGGYVLLNADLSYYAASGKWSVTAFGRNLTDHPVYQGGFPDILNGFGGPTAPTFIARTIGAPRTYGLRATINF
jgi:iron complex outermembrane receptor protein